MFISSPKALLSSLVVSTLLMAQSSAVDVVVYGFDAGVNSATFVATVSV